ncbi:MAG: hypothetical protein AAF927_02925 [Bacteroidota bacterium]
MDITDLYYTYAKIIEKDDEGNDRLVGYALHTVTEVSDCRYVASGSKVNTTPKEKVNSTSEENDDVYEVELYLSQDLEVLYFPFTTPLVHVVNLEELKLDEFPDRKMEIVVMVDGKKKNSYPVNQPSPNEIRRPIDLD